MGRWPRSPEREEFLIAHATYLYLISYLFVAYCPNFFFLPSTDYASGMLRCPVFISSSIPSCFPLSLALSPSLSLSLYMVAGAASA